MQARFQNRPSHLNMFAADTVGAQPEAESGAAYGRIVAALMDGKWMLPLQFWVFLMCTAFSMLICAPGTEGRQYKPFNFHDETVVGSESRSTLTSQLCLVRWCHRITPQALISQHSDGTSASDHVDPLGTVFGCDRIAWARKDEAVHAKGYAKLNDDMQKAIHRTHQLTHGDSARGSKRDRPGALCAARSRLDAFCKDRYRLDDAFAGVAYCAVQSTSVAATPISVTPVFQTARHDQWCPRNGYTKGKASSDFRSFTATQGYKLSGYYQFRANHLVRAKSEYL